MVSVSSKGYRTRVKSDSLSALPKVNFNSCLCDLKCASAYFTWVRQRHLMSGKKYKWHGGYWKQHLAYSSRSQEAYALTTRGFCPLDLHLPIVWQISVPRISLPTVTDHMAKLPDTWSNGPGSELHPMGFSMMNSEDSGKRVPCFGAYPGE